MSAAVLRAFFDAWNRREIDEAMEHVAEDCHYDDFSFARPHVGRAEVRTLFEKVAEMAPGVTFLLHDVTGSKDVGTYWEIVNDGVPTGRVGVSFYRFDDNDKLVWALDAPDPGPKHRRHDYH